MTLIALAAPYSLKTARLELAPDGDIGTAPTATYDDYTAAVSDVNFTPTTATATWTGIGGNTLTDIGAPVWALGLGYAQDLAEDSLQRYLHEHHGETRLARFTPVTAAGEPGTGVPIYARVRLAAGGIGGKAGADVAVATSTFGVIGAPVFGTGGGGE